MQLSYTEKICYRFEGNARFRVLEEHEGRRQSIVISPAVAVAVSWVLVETD